MDSKKFLRVSIIVFIWYWIILSLVGLISTIIAKYF